MSGVVVWYEIQVIVRDLDPFEFGPIRLEAAHTDNPEMAMHLLQEEINGQWVAAMREGRLWDITSDANGFNMVNPQMVLMVAVEAVSPPAEQADAPAASAGASGSEDEWPEAEAEVDSAA